RPPVESLTAVAHAQGRALIGLELHASDDAVLRRHRHDDPRLAVQLEAQIVENGVLRRERQRQVDLACRARSVRDPVRSREIDRVGGIPEQPLLAVLELEHDVDVARLYGNRPRDLRFHDLDDLLAVFHGFDLAPDALGPAGAGWLLDLRRAPDALDLLPQAM